MPKPRQDRDRDESVSFGDGQDPEAVLRALLQVDMDDVPDDDRSEGSKENGQPDTN